MRTTISIDEDAHRFASIYAAAKGIILSAAINELIRKAQSIPPLPPDIRRSSNGLPCFAPIGKGLTLRMIKEADSDSN
jgi:hypothetical protein